MTSPTTGYKDKKHSLIGLVSKGDFGAKTVLKMERKRWLANFVKGMLFGFEQPFLEGERCVTSPKKGCRGGMDRQNLPQEVQ